MKRAAFYLRVSHERQLEKFGPAVQHQNARQYAQRHGLEIVKTYEDAITGKSARREALDALLTDAALYDAVIVSSVDRLARRVPVAYGVVAELSETGLELHSTDMGVIDLDDEASNVQFGIRSLFADVDHRKIARRMHDARIRKVASGTPERPLNGYGWRKGEVDERERHWLTWMYERAAHIGWHAISEELNAQGVRTRAGKLWTPRQVGNLLTNPLYMGRYEFGRSRGVVRAVCEVPALVSPEVWARAQGRRGRTKTSRQDVFPLTGRIVCGDCGSAVSGTTMKDGRYAYYVCHSVFIGKSLRRTCASAKRVPAHALHDALRGHLGDLLTDDELHAQALRVPAPPPVNTGAMQADVTRRLARLDAAYDAGAYPPDEYATRRRALLAERDTLARPTALPPPPADLAAARARLAHALTLPDLHAAAEALGLRLTLHPGPRLDVSLDV